MTRHTVLIDILGLLGQAGLSISDFLRELLTSPALKSQLLVQEIITSPTTILELFLEADVTGSTTQEWIYTSISSIFAAEVQSLTKIEAGYQFIAQNVSISQLEDCDIARLALGMENQAPLMWKLLGRLLQADSTLIQRRKNDRLKKARKAIHRRSQASSGHDVNKIGKEIGDSDIEINELDTEESSDDDLNLFSDDNVPGNILDLLEEKANTLIKIKKIVCMSILMNCSNQKCNMLQTMIGIFLQSCGAPQAVVDLLSHLGLSIAASTINTAITSLSEKAEQKIKTVAATLTTAYAYDNLDINLKHYTPTLENTHESTIVHLTSGAMFPLNHGVTTHDLDCTDILQEILSNPNPVGMEKLEEFFWQKEDAEGTYSWSRFNEWKICYDLLHHGPKYFRKFIPQLEKPEELDCIPVVKTSQVPLRASKTGPSTPAANGEVLTEFFKQANIGDSVDIILPDTKEPLQDIGNKVILVFGDLLTGQHLRSLMLQRSEESRPFRRFQPIIYVLGLFHFKMACVDAIWRAFISPTKAKSGPNSLMNFVKQIRKNDVGKLSTKPDFRAMHEVVQHVGIVIRLDAWRSVVQQKFGGLVLDLEGWAQAEPSWEEICILSRKIASEFTAPPDMDKIRNNPDNTSDRINENIKLFHWHALLYEETSYAMNHGDIGRVESTFMSWIYIFTGCGKHKYATELIRYLENIHFRYPKPLSRAIRMNILCNPTGRSDHFRAIDWVIEHNNLYTKRIHGGQFSNHTIERIVKESPLIEVYKTIRQQFEDMFCLGHRTTRHSPADMTSTFHKLTEYMVKEKTNQFIPGRKAEHTVQNLMAIGMKKLWDGLDEKAKSDDKEEHENVEIEVEDDGSLDL